jgi:hypothetical protein
MDWFKKHADAVVTISLMFAGFLWMNGKFNAIEKDITIIKTVLIMKQIMPPELACTEKNKCQN